VLGRVQRGLESLYRVDTGVAVDDFVIDAPTRDSVIDLDERRPREQLLVLEDAGEMSLALFVDPLALANLAQHGHDPSRMLDDGNLGDFLLAVEGVSHFIFAIWCARASRSMTQLELELQAEVDKYVTCLLVGQPSTQTSTMWRERLFGDPCYETDLDGDELARYRAANDNAQRYAAWLEQAFVASRRIPEMLAELRKFYRRGLADKLSSIATAA
jgi:hypothetical protein